MYPWQRKLNTKGPQVEKKKKLAQGVTEKREVCLGHSELEKAGHLHNCFWCNTFPLPHRQIHAFLSRVQIISFQITALVLCGPRCPSLILIFLRVPHFEVVHGERLVISLTQLSKLHLVSHSSCPGGPHHVSHFNIVPLASGTCSSLQTVGFQLIKWSNVWTVTK